MTNKFLIVDRIVQVDDWVPSALFDDFAYDSENTSAPDSRNQGPICSVSLLKSEAVHGVERLSPAFSVSHVLTLERDHAAILLADDEFRRACMRPQREGSVMDLLLLAVYSRLTYYKTVLVHGALIDVPGYGGILFTGRSGVGKTTQAELWNQYAGADIINGDRVFLAVQEGDEDAVYAYGSPWCGSSPYCVNRRTPLRAVIDLNREEKKYISPLGDFEALAASMPSVIMPVWDVRLTEMVMDTLDAALPRVPFYHMSCTKDASAVEMAARALGLN